MPQQLAAAQTMTFVISLNGKNVLYLATSHRGKKIMLLAAFYVLAITLIIMHYTGWLARHNLEWLLYIMALTVFPAVIWL